MAAVAKIAVVEYVFVGSPQLGCIPASLADNPYTHGFLFKENSMPCSRKGFFVFVWLTVNVESHNVSMRDILLYFVGTEIKYLSCDTVILGSGIRLIR